ncbi:hypothetical protein C0993_001120 [Termitomyces sp. T159_Od127]|nr:hypothetical protein C0993_001120 [Termitomyces sp. T159_Od127]
MFNRSFVEGQLQEWGTGDIDKKTIDIANRYMTKIDKVQPGAVHIPFDQHMDPKGALESMTKSGFIRTEDNVVNYMAKKMVGDKTRIEQMAPYAFRIGDIVEAEMSFVVIPLKGQTFKMLAVLRSLIHLDGSFRQRNNTNKVNKVQTINLKRKVTMCDDEGDAKRKGVEQETQMQTEED